MSSFLLKRTINSRKWWTCYLVACKIRKRGESMETEQRRDALLVHLMKTSTPIKGQDLAKTFQVSRQVIVQDIAILRARGTQVVATPAGYLVLQKSKTLVKVIACSHELTPEAMKHELDIMIMYGAKVIDVIVEHPIYGEIRAVLNLKSLHDVAQFIEKITHHSKPLSCLTQGVHFHTIEVEDEQCFKKIQQALRECEIFYE